MSYLDKLKDPRWQKLRLRVFDRDGWKCRCCGSVAKTLHAHHPVYHPWSEGPWDYDEDTIVTLCAECHTDQHTNLKVCQANLLMELASQGRWSTFDLDCVLSIISQIDFVRSTPDSIVMKGQP